MLWVGISLKHAGRLDEAATVLKDGMNKYPDNRYFRPNLVYTYLERGQKARGKNDHQYASEQFVLAYRTDPSNESALLWYAIVMREKKNSAEAVRLFTEGKKSFPRNPLFHREPALDLYRVGLPADGKQRDRTGAIGARPGEGGPAVRSFYRLVPGVHVFQARS